MEIAFLEEHIPILFCSVSFIWSYPILSFISFYFSAVDDSSKELRSNSINCFPRFVISRWVYHSLRVRRGGEASEDEPPSAAEETFEQVRTLPAASSRH